MKKITLLLAILYSSICFGQDDAIGGTPVQGIIPIKRTEIQSPSANKSANQTLSTPTPSTPTGSSTEVGITEGELSVSLTGGANYNIPIAVPPGINGVVPQILLSYNSQSGNGLAGFGWNVSGVSVITRIASTKFHDNDIDPVDFDALDRFSFDGQRLMVKNGTSGTYGANGTVYETESFSNVQVTSYGVHPNGASYGPAYFIVQYPDGSIAHYGNSSNSRSRTDWAITYWQNPQGVRISYNYILSNNNLSISSIQYGSRLTTIPINEIQFVYKTRQRAEQAYIGGESFVRNTILSEIRVRGNNVGYRNYVLAHETTSLGYERLKSITEKSGDNTKSYNPTVFNYDTTTNTDLFDISNPITLNVGNISFANSSNISGDFDGDGKLDFILYPTTGTEAKNKYWLFTNVQGSSLNIGYEHNVGAFKEIFPTSWLSWNEKLMPMQGWCVIQHTTSTNVTTFKNYSSGTVNPVYYQYEKAYEFPKFTYSYYKEPCTGGGGLDPLDPSPLDPGLSPMDPSLNPNIGKSITTTSDTKEEAGTVSERPIIPIDPEEGVWTVITREIPKEYVSGDFNGDGLTDVIVIEKSVSLSYMNGCYSYNATHTGGRTFFVDLDRRLTTNFVNVSGYITTTSSSKFSVADVNGDGKSDLLVFDSGSVKAYYLNDNKQLIQIISKSDASIISDKPRYMGDFNGDGKLDFVIPQADNTDSWSFFFSKGTDFQKITTSIGLQYRVANGGYYGVVGYNINTYSLNEHSFVTNDFNGDGKTDILYQQNLTVEYVMTSGGADYTNYGNPQITKLVLMENKFTDGTGIGFNLVNTNAQFGGIRRNPMPVFLDHNNVNQNLEYALISGNAIRTFKSTKDNRKDTRLNEIILGSGVKEIITYAPLNTSCNVPYNCDIPFSSSAYTENYPNFDINIANGFQVVSAIEQVTAGQYKKQKFKYHGAVSNLEGLGFLGFRGLSRTNWFNDDNPAISSISKHDVLKRGSIYETYTVPGETYGNFTSYTPTNFISKTNMSYEEELLANKVYKIKNTFTQNINGLENTSKEVTSTHDVYNNPLITTSVYKNGTTVENTDVTTLEYYNQPTGSSYYIGRTKKKNSSVTHNGDNSTAEEIYTYNAAQLVSKIHKKGHLTNYITQDNSYDIFGNLTQKTITATGLTPRTVSFTFDASGRFLTSSTDVENQTTTYTYNSNNGLLLTQTLPSNAGYPLTTTYTYDVWNKKTKETDYLGKSRNYSYSWLSPGSSGFYSTGVSGDDDATDFVWLDDLGRKIAEGNNTVNDSSFSEPGQTTRTYEYDIYNRVKKAYEPKLSIFPQWSGLSTTTVFDLYGRTVQITEATGKTTNISYNGLTTTSNDGVSNSVTIKNSLGNIVSTTDNGGTITYQYFANGNLKQSNFGGVISSIEQDGWGRKTKLIDPSAGTHLYEYNEFGEIKKEITPRGEINYTIDSTGKVTEKTIVGTDGDTTNSKTTYTYSPSTKLLTNARFDDFAGGFYTLYSYGYDNYKRMNFSDESGFNAYYQRATQFDAFGRPEKELYSATNTADMKSSHKWVRNTYKNGYHWQILDDATNQLLWQTSKVNAKGQILNATYGNGITVANTYDQYGFPTQFKHDKAGSPITNILTLNTTFTPQRGNLTYRYNSMFDYREDFTYDNLDRLSTWKETGDLLFDCNFTSSTEGFQPVNGASLSLSSGRLAVSAVGQAKGTEKLVLTNATPGKKINIKGNVVINASAGAASLHISFYEKDPVTGNMVNNTTLGMPIGNGNFSFGTTVSTYSEIYVKFAINSATNPSAAFMAFSLDDVKITLEKNGTQTYDGLGRIDESEIGSYNYTNNSKIFQNTSVELNPDAATYYQGRSDLQITYNVFKSPLNIIEEGKDKLSFIYNMNNGRSTMYYGGLQSDKLLRPYRKHYSAEGNMEIKQTVGSGVEIITYIGGDGYSAPVILKSDGTTQEYMYLHRDYLGSIIAVTNQAGNIVEKRLFDAWGKITRVQNGSGANLAKLTVIDRGYTGHEHLQGVGLIHMNARLYDPIVHRFLQPDNFIQDPYNTQNFNRYGYVLNNPLKFTDATGEFAWIPVIIGAVIGAYSGGVLANGGEFNPTKWEWNGKTLGYMLGGAIVGGVTGGVSNGIATSGVAFANTKAILVGSIINGMGTHIYTGGKTDITLSFGFASLNFTTGEFGYLFKKGNSFMENLAYGLGAIANASDILAGMNPGEVQLNTDTSDAIGHSAITTVGETDELTSLVSVGPDITGKRIFNPFDLTNKADTNWHNYVTKSGTWKTVVKGVNVKAISNYSADLANGAKYNLYFSSCVNHTARALTFAGVPTLGIHPFILHAQMYLRSIGFRPAFILNQYNNF